MMRGMTPIHIKLEEVVKRYNIKEKSGNRTIELDHDVEFKYWPHQADAETIDEVVGNEEATVKAYTDGIAIFKGSEMVAKLKLKLDDRCSNNQAVQLAIIRALEAIESMNRHIINPRRQ